jgi:hypothetical protein
MMGSGINSGVSSQAYSRELPRVAKPEVKPSASRLVDGHALPDTVEVKKQQGGRQVRRSMPS